MKPAPFDYHAPEDIDGALALLSTHGDEAKVLAGGQSLVPLLALRLARFDALVDVGRIDALTGIEQRDGHLVIGATTRQSTILRDRLVRRHVPLLADATRLIGHFQIRNRGTIGGSLAHADPAAEYPAIALALDAEVEVASASGRRTIPAAELIDAAYVTTLEPEELLVSVRVPVAPPRSGWAIEEIARRHGDFALAGAIVTVTLDDADRIGQARVVVFGLAERALRLPAVEAALAGALDVDVTEPVAAAIAELDPPSDVQATSQYRKTVAGPLLQRALARALQRATEPEESLS